LDINEPAKPTLFHCLLIVLVSDLNQAAFATVELGAIRQQTASCKNFKKHMLSCDRKNRAAGQHKTKEVREGCKDAASQRQGPDCLMHWRKGRSQGEWFSYKGQGKHDWKHADAEQVCRVVKTGATRPPLLGRIDGASM
jgi:hypothetical protein